MTHQTDYTVFSYLYRDASNYKSHGELILQGQDDGTAKQIIRDNCEDQENFVAEQVGIPALYDELYAYSDGPNEDDHCFHEFEEMHMATEEEVAGRPVWGSLKEITDRFRQTQGQWDLSLSPNIDFL